MVLVIVGVAFFLGASLGLSLSISPEGIATLWPPNAVILTAMLLTHPRRWWGYLAVMTLPYVFGDLSTAYSVQRSILFYAANCLEVLVAAFALRSVLKDNSRLCRLRDMALFLLWAVLLAPVLSAFVASCASFNEPQLGYWHAWQGWFLGDALGHLALTPVLLLWVPQGVSWIKEVPLRRLVEAVCLALCLGIVVLVGLGGEGPELASLPALLYAPLPLLLWSAIRFGPRGICTAVFAFAILSIWSAIHARGPFALHTPAENVFSLQIFLIAASIPMMLLGSLLAERLGTERALRESEHTYRELFEDSPVSIWREDFSAVGERMAELRAQGVEDLRRHLDQTPGDLLDLVGRVKVVDVNERSVEMFGARSKQDLMSGLARHFSDDSLVAFKEEMLALWGGADVFEVEAQALTLEGERIDVLLRMNVGRGEQGPELSRVIVTMADITERSRAAEERGQLLHTTRERVKELRCLYGVAEAIRKRSSLDETFREVVGLIPAGWQYPELTRGRIRLQGQEYTSPDFEETEWRQSADIVNQGKSLGVIDVFYTKACPELDEGPFLEEERDLIDGIALALGEAVGHEQAVGARERLMHAIEQTDESIVITDASATVQYVNPAFVNLTGYTLDEARERGQGVLVGSEPEGETSRALWEAISSGRPWRGQLANRKKDGTPFTEDVSVSPVVDSQGVVVNYVTVRRDITDQLRVEEEKAKLEQQYHQAQKMESVGRLAGGVAHDFNNLLTVIYSHADMALAEVPPGSTLHQDLEQILEAGHRAAALTRQLLAFGRKQVMEPQTLDLNKIVEEMTKLLRRLIGEDIELVEVLAEDLGCVTADPSQVEQVLMNLAVNARDAMPGGGRLTIKTANIEPGDRALDGEVGTVDRRHVMLSVVDNGEGMSKETVARAFEPFFTTKEEGQGTGLGLATVHGIIEQSGGHIRVQSELGRGTTFTIYLPIAMAEAVKPVVEPAVGATGGSETILVVEDENAVRTLVSRILTAAGYQVLAVASGQEALDACERASGRFDLMLTDVVMPGMNGLELAERLAKTFPNLKVLFMSGYENGAVDSSAHFISKPFRAAALRDKVKSVL